MAEVPNIPIDGIPDPESTDLLDTENIYPLLEQIQGAPSADSVGPEAGNRQPRALDIRTETLRGAVNKLITVLNALNDNFLHRDGSAATVDGVPSPSYMRGNLDMGDNPTAPVLHKVVNLAAGTIATDAVNKGQLDALQTFLDSLETDLLGCLFTNGTNQMLAPLNMGGNRVEFMAEPINASDGVTKNYHDAAFTALNTGYVKRDGSLAMLGNLNMGGFKITNMNLASPTQDGDGVSRGYLLTVLGLIAVTPPGTIAAFAGDEISIPIGWLLCTGQAVSRTTFAGLFTVIGITYGSGDGSTTFNVPDFRGRVAMGKDNMGGTPGGVVNNALADVLGGTLGAETVALVLNNLPAHTHTYNDKVVQNGTGGTDLGPANTNTTSVFTDIAGRITSSTGSGTAHDNVQPSIAMNIIVKFVILVTTGASIYGTCAQFTLRCISEIAV